MKDNKKDTSVYVETKDGVKEIKNKKDENIKILGDFKTTKLLINPKFQFIEAVLIDENFIKSLINQDDSNKQEEYAVTVYKDETLTQRIILDIKSDKLYIESENNDINEGDDPYIYKAYQKVSLKKGQYISRINGLYNKVADPKELTEKIQEAIKIILGE